MKEYIQVAQFVFLLLLIVAVSQHITIQNKLDRTRSKLDVTITRLNAKIDAYENQ